MRTIEETLNDAKGLVEKIYENMSVVETCEAISEKIKVMKVCYTAGENQILVLDKVLDEDQMKQTDEFITKMISSRRDEAQRYLDFLNGKIPAIPNPVFEEAVKEMVAEDVTKDKMKSQSRTSSAEASKKQALSLDEIKKMLADGKSVLQIADYYGYKGTCVVYDFMKKNGLKNPGEKKKEEKKFRTLNNSDIPKIKELYTNGKMNLKEVADQLGVRTTDIHNFISIHGLARPTKKDDMFRDSKVGQDEFRAKMLAGRK